jgi:hypothetical protein
VVIGRAQDGYGCRLPGGAISAMMGHGDRGVMVDKIVGVMSVVASISAGGFWLWASLVNVPDNIDTFVGKLQWIGRLNAVAAFAACVAAACAAYMFWRQTF